MSEWCTIESDPGVFSELIKNIGVKGVQVDEIIDMDILEVGNEPVYGLIFLFKYMKNSGYKPNVLTSWDKDLFFAKQEVQNACATQAIYRPNFERIKIFHRRNGSTNKGTRNF